MEHGKITYEEVADWCSEPDKALKLFTLTLDKQIGVFKSRELLGNPEEDNQQPSSSGDTEKGSTTSSESQEDNNSTTSAGHR